MNATRMNVGSLPAIGELLTPAQAMRIALDQGQRGAGHVSPNPLVGCTIVDRDHRFLAAGFHARLGGDHAEAAALRSLNDPARVAGAHVYVTLEPCAHQGRTPSCARTLAPLKPASVTYAVEDPNPLVAGKGAQILREAGVEVKLLSAREDISVGEREELIRGSEELAEVFLHNQRSGEPFVAVKVASTLDGKMALASGESKWITGPTAREHVHLMRARYDAIAVGYNTFVADDPSLNIRHPDYPSFQNKVILFDPEAKSLSVMENSNLLKVRPAESVYVFVAKGARTVNPAGVQVVEIPVDDRGIFEMTEVLSNIRRLGLQSVMIEGGAQLYGGFFNSLKVQRVHVYVAPLILGGKHGLAWSSHFGVAAMADRIHLDHSRRLTLGDDLYWTARVRFA